MRNEPEAQLFAAKIADATKCSISVINLTEAAVVIDASQNPIASRKFDEFVKTANLVVEPVSAEQGTIARQAYRDFGKGSGHPAKLNFGDCFAYALAKT